MANENNPEIQERSILEKVYDPCKFEEILENEEPDFLLKGKDDSEYFGVAIETSVTPETTKYANIIADIIDNQNRKYKVYQNRTSCVNLIIYDIEPGFCKISPEHFYENFFTTKIKKALFSSRFKEVFLITKLENEKEVYIPMMLLLFVSELYFFNEFVTRFYKKELKRPKGDELALLFAQYLYNKEVCQLFSRVSQRRLELIWGNYGAYFTKNNQVSFNDYYNSKLPNDVLTVPLQKNHAVINGDFSIRFDDYPKNNKFVSGLAMDVLKRM